MPQVIDPTKVVVGAANIYNRALAVTTAWNSVGATMDDSTVTINQTWYRPDLAGMLGPVQGMDYLSEQSVECAFSMVEIAGTKLALAIPGATSATEVVTEGGSLTTTLAANSAIGATNIKVASVTTVVTGDVIGIDVVAGGLREYRTVDFVGTTGSGGSGLSFRDPLKLAHLSGVVVLTTLGDGKVEITGSTLRRMPDSAYNQWAVVSEAPNGYYEMLLTSGISTTDSAEIAFGDDTTGFIRTTIQARYAGATPTTPPWQLRVPA